MSNGSGCQGLLTKAGNQHRVVAHQIRQDYLDGMGRFKKNVPSLKNNAHAPLTESFLQLVARVEDGLAHQRVSSHVAVLRTVVNIVWETTPTGWTFFH